MIEEFKARPYVPAVLIADIYTALEDNANAFIWLEKGRAARSPVLMFTRVAPSHDTLRKDPRFNVLMKKIGFPVECADE